LFFEDAGWTSGCHGLDLRGCRAVLFSCGCTPTHPFVDATADCGRRSARGRSAEDRLARRALSILLRPSREHMAVSISLTPDAGPGPSGTADWPRVARASSARREEGPMQPRRFRLPVLISPRPSREPLPPSPSPRPSPVGEASRGRGDGEGGRGGPLLSSPSGGSLTLPRRRSQPA